MNNIVWIQCVCPSVRIEWQILGAETTTGGLPYHNIAVCPSDSFVCLMAKDNMYVCMFVVYLHTKDNPEEEIEDTSRTTSELIVIMVDCVIVQAESEIPSTKSSKNVNKSLTNTNI